MRATISFETDVDQVEGTMGVLVAQEAHNLRAAADLMEDYIAPQDNVLEKVTVALGLLHETTTQLQQYQQMLVGFERARFETIVPQPANEPMSGISSDAVGPLAEAVEETANTAEHMQQFNEFLSRIQEHAANASQTAEAAPEGTDGGVTEEG